MAYAPPEEKWYHLADKLSRVDEQLDVIIEQLNQVITLLRHMARAAVLVEARPEVRVEEGPTAPQAPVTTVPARVRIVDARSITVTEEPTRYKATADTIILTPEADVLVAGRPDQEGLLVTAGSYLTLRLAEPRELWIKARSGTARVYLAEAETRP